MHELRALFGAAIGRHAHNSSLYFTALITDLKILYSDSFLVTPFSIILDRMQAKFKTKFFFILYRYFKRNGVYKMLKTYLSVSVACRFAEYIIQGTVKPC